MMEMPKLLMWDIDGTLMNCRGSGRRAFNRTFEELYGIANAFDHVELAGAVDGQVLYKACEFHGISFEDSERFFSHYGVILEEELQNGQPVLFQGVREILSLTGAEVTPYNIVGTGNCEIGARKKLEHFSLTRFFPVGGYGSEAVERCHVLSKGLQAANNHFGISFRPKSVIVIGDTPLDIVHARRAGFSSIGVATGGYSEDELMRHGPNRTITDFSNPDRFLDMLRSCFVSEEEDSEEEMA